jgi:hypothetical protein
MKRKSMMAFLSTPLIAIIIVIILVLTTVPTGWYVAVYNKDTDDDGVPNRLDAFPNDGGETKDSDGDGWGDNGDAFPADPAQWSDPDNDGYGETTDAFPNDPTEWKDTDGDGYGDNGDAFPQDPNEWSDRDKDGHGDRTDVFPDDADEWKDSDGDGQGDNADPDDDNDGVLDTQDLFPYKNAYVRLILQKFTLLDPIDTGWDGDPKYGNMWLTVNIRNNADFRIPESGTNLCELNIPWEVKTVGGEEMVVDVPDNIAEWVIEIQAWDEDSWSENDLVDLSPTSARTLTVTINIQTNLISGDVTTGFADGSGDGTQDTDDDDGRIEFQLERIF